MASQVGQVLRDARHSRGVTLSDFALAHGVRETTWRRLNAPSSRPGIDPVYLRGILRTTRYTSTWTPRHCSPATAQQAGHVRGSAATGGIMHPGAVIQLTGEDEIQLRIGGAEAVEFSLNGAWYGNVASNHDGPVNVTCTADSSCKVTKVGRHRRGARCRRHRPADGAVCPAALVGTDVACRLPHRCVR